MGGGGSSGGSQQQSQQDSETTVVLPEYLRKPVSDVAALTGGLVNRPYIEYQGQRVAELTPQELMAADLANTTPWAGDLDSARGALDMASSLGSQGMEQFNAPWLSGNTSSLSLADLFSDSDLARYMNPFTDTAIQPGIDKLNSTLTSDLNAVRHRAAKAGGFGGSRQALLESELVGSSRKSAADLLNTGRQRAFDTALQAFQADRQTRLNALSADRGFDLSRRSAGLAALDSDRSGALSRASAYGNLGNTRQAMLGTQMKNLATAGGMKRTFDQGKLDTSYEGFVNARDYDFNKSSALTRDLGNLIGGTRGSTTKSASTVRSNTNSDDSRDNTARYVGAGLSALSGIANYGQNNGWFGSGGGSGIADLADRDMG